MLLGILSTVWLLDCGCYDVWVFLPWSWVCLNCCLVCVGDCVLMLIVLVYFVLFDFYLCLV